MRYELKYNFWVIPLSPQAEMWPWKRGIRTMCCKQSSKPAFLMASVQSCHDSQFWASVPSVYPNRPLWVKLEVKRPDKHDENNPGKKEWRPELRHCWRVWRKRNSSEKDERILYRKPKSENSRKNTIPSMTASVSILLNSQFSTI